MKRFLGVVCGAGSTYQVLHITDAFAMGYTNTSPVHRLSAVMFGILVLLLLMELFRRLFSPSFFHGFLVATGLFLSFDIVVFHWIFKLHRITNGPEANVLEPIFVAFGCMLLGYGLRLELRLKTNRSVQG